MQYKHSLRNLLSLFLAMGSLVLIGCSNDSSISSTVGQSEATGTANFKVRLGKIGALAKRQSIELNTLRITLSSPGKDTLTDTFSVNGTGGNEIEFSIDSIAAPAVWKLNALCFDKAGVVVHSNSISFPTLADDTVDVVLNMDAKYSMLRTSFNSIPDSVNAVKMIIHGIDTLDAAFTKGAVDSVKLSYDYLPADTAGIAHAVSLYASGSFCGTDTVLYAADTTIISKSGVDLKCKITMKWVGPGVPHGEATMTVTVGTIGFTLVNANFEQK